MEKDETGKRDLLFPKNSKRPGNREEELRHLPYLNLSRRYAEKGMLIYAVRELKQALEVSPGHPVCLAALQQIHKLLN